MKQTLEGIRVLDLAPLLPGSLCTQMLADLGAEIIKIESPNGGDNFRTAPPLVGTTGSFFHILNRNKKGITLNLKNTKAKAIFLDLVKKADIVIENFRPGTLEKWGLTVEALHAINPKLIIARVSGYGQYGPYAEKAGFAAVAEAIFPLQTLEGMAFDAEVLLIARKHGYKIREVPINWYFNPDSRVRLVKDSLRMALDLLVMRRNARLGLYDPR